MNILKDKKSITNSNTRSQKTKFKVGKNNFTYVQYAKDLLHREYIWKSPTQNGGNPVDQLAEYLNRYFIKDETQSLNMKNYSFP